MERALIILGLCLILTGCATSSCLTNLQPWPDPSGMHINLQQCWDKSDQIQFYTTNQGGQIAPYDLIKHLEMPRSTDKFFTRANFDRWRFLPLEETDRDRDSDVDKDVQDWPLGFVINSTSSGKQAWHGNWLGVNCAACHTAQIEYQGKKMRVDGAPTMSNLNQFLWDLQAALKATYEDGLNNGEKFERYAKNFPREWDRALLNRLGRVVTDGELWHHRNDPPTPPGYARFDAVGLIFNQLIFMSGSEPVGNFKNDAPVSFPFLWDTSHHNQTQWNGVAPDIPMVRNITQGIGAFAKYDPQAGTFQEPSTIPLSNQRKLQRLVHKLRSPAWPEDILGKIDPVKKARGSDVFEQKCASCHGSQKPDSKHPPSQKRDEPLRYLRVIMTPVQEVKTDGNMVANADHRELRGPDGTEKRVADAAGDVVKDIVFSGSHPTEFFPFAWESISAFFRWQPILDLFRLKFNFGREEFGDRYKARPLDGIWATAPYLHNGSVPNLHQLLVPSERKPFYVGSRQFDKEHVGFITDDKSGTWFDPNIPGNLNTGHDDTTYNGPLDMETEVWPLIEYMKSL
ncbi:MAG: di-heme-cytochrome C peroxidase [Nitrospira sp.]